MLGAGVAGASVARALVVAGHAVRVFDKSRGPGGRLATRRIEWVDRQGQATTTRLDHGAIGIGARSAAFRDFIEQAVGAGGLAEWTPRLSTGSLPLEGDGRLWVPVPDMPSLCRGLLEGLAASWSFAVDGLDKDAAGWQLRAGGERHPERFDAVVLAIPPAQAAPLLAPHRLDWARDAAVVAMQPCWTLMGVATAPEPALDWDLARPPTGPLAWVIRDESRRGRARVAGRAHWVVHARADWSRQYLEQPTEWVQAQMQAALAEFLGQPVDWWHCTVHRWRYAQPQAQTHGHTHAHTQLQTHTDAPAGSCWWDASQGLGVCGDFFGGAGVESAWWSAQSMCAALPVGPGVAP